MHFAEQLTYTWDTCGVTNPIHQICKRYLCCKNSAKAIKSSTHPPTYSTQNALEQSAQQFMIPLIFFKQRMFIIPPYGGCAQQSNSKYDLNQTLLMGTSRTEVVGTCALQTTTSAMSHRIECITYSQKLHATLNPSQ